MTSKTLVLVLVAAGSLGLAGCRTHAGTGSLIGAGLGTALGSAIGRHNHNRSAGMLIGGAAGALAGYAIGNEMDKDHYGHRYEGDPYYEPRYRDRVVERRTYYVHEPPPRVIYRERYYYDDCNPCW